MKTKRIEVKVERETAKALFVSDGQRSGWIQRRWFEASTGTVAVATFEKAVEHAAERAADREAERIERAEEQAFRDSAHRVAVARETEKAVAAELILSVPGGDAKSVLAWFPKSQVTILDGGIFEVAGWMIRDRERRAADEYVPRGYYESHRACKGEGTQVARGIQTI